MIGPRMRVAALTLIAALVCAVPVTITAVDQDPDATMLAQQARAKLDAAAADFRASRYDAAQHNSATAHVIAERIGHVGLRGRASYYLGLVDDRRGRSAEALKHFDAAVADLTAADDPMLSSALLEAMSARNVHPVTGADQYRRALEVAERSANKVRVGAVLHQWGDQLFVFSKHEAALEKYEAAASVFASVDAMDDAGTVYNSLGRLYRRHGQLETALAFQKRALRIHENSTRPIMRMQSNNAVGVTLQALGRHREARPYLERALAIAREAKNVRMEDFVAGNLSSTLLNEGAFDAVAVLLEGVIARKLDAYPSLRYYNLAEAYREVGQLDRALDAANQSIATCGERADLACVDALHIRSKVRLARNERSLALDDLEQALQLVEDARTRLIPADFFKQRFGQSATALFGSAIELQLAASRTAEALDTAEQARGRAFMDLLASQDMSPPASYGTTGTTAATLRSEYTAPSPKSDALVAIAARLRSTLLLYWVANDRLFIWTVQPGGRINATTVQVRESRLAELVTATGQFGSAATSTVWRSLYDLLIKPVRHQLPDEPGSLVTVVPHGPLSMLSFAALQDQRSRHLIEDYTLHYVPAAGILQFTESRLRRTASAQSTLVVADPKLPRRSSLDRPLLALPGAREEARAIARLAPRRSVMTLEGDAADEASVREHVGGKHVIHFATHVIVSDAEPLKSFLALASTGASAAQDGILTAQEVYGLRLEADLVLLSACRSGGGRLTGDGMTTFARAFIYAGTPSLITSVWDVADESSSHLVPEFYRHWRNGASKASALRTAQLDFLKKLRAGTFMIETAAGAVLLPEHPALWAGFTLIGEPN